MALLCDIDGVILHDDRPLPGAVEFVRRLTERQVPFLFLTNYPSQTPSDLAARLSRAGIEVEPTRFYTSAMATAEFLREQAGERRRVFVLGEGALSHELYQAGFILAESDADFVVLGETRGYNFELIQRASAEILRGARFIATNADIAGPSGRPACGALAAPIERITGRRPFYVGKPNAYMMRAALRALSAHSENTWMLGDNMETDIIAGIQSGLRTVLVLTGVSREVDLERYAYRPHFLAKDLEAVERIMELT
ncbi:MAG: HAD-IIA family hydrolase [Candidatus Eisenbacteria bacterium]